MTTTVTVTPTFVGIDTFPGYTPNDEFISMVGGGGSDTFSDGSDSTYVAIGDASPSNIPRLDYTGPVLSFPGIDIPVGSRRPGTDVLGATFTFSMRARTSSSGVGASVGVLVGYDSFYGSGNVSPDGFQVTLGFGFAGTLTTSWQNLTSDVNWDSDDNNDPFNYLHLPRTEVLRLGVDFILLPWIDVSIDVSELSMTVSWDPPTAAPPLRQFPRDDGLATSTARRFWPPPRSTQRGIRRAGHTYP